LVSEKGKKAWASQDQGETNVSDKFQYGSSHRSRIKGRVMSCLYKGLYFNGSRRGRKRGKNVMVFISQNSEE